MQENQDEDWALAAAKHFAESAVGTGLKIPVEAVAEVFRQMETVGDDLSGVERLYNTDEAAQFLGKSPQWMYWAMKPREKGGGGQFYYVDGAPIEPERIGDKGIRRFSLAVIKDMAASMYRKTTISYDELEVIVGRVKMARLGRWSPEVTKKPSKRKRKKASKTHGAEADRQGSP